MKKITIADVAEQAKVSKTTVSRYLRNENVKAEIADKIAAAIKESGYQVKPSCVKNADPAMLSHTDENAVNNIDDQGMIDQTTVKKLCSEDDHLQILKTSDTLKKENAETTKTNKKGLKPKKHYTFALLCKDLTQSRTRYKIKALQGILHDYDCTLQVCMSEGKSEFEKHYLASFVTQGVNAILIDQCSDVSFIQAQMQKSTIPVLFLNDEKEGIQSASFDETRAGEILGEYLLERQHLIIRYLGIDVTMAESHIEGIKKAYHKLRQPGDFKVYTCEPDYLDMFEKIKEIFENKIDLLILENDEMAIPASKYLKEYHIAVPQNTSMISFGGHSLTEIMSPTLTALAYDYEAYATYVSEYLFALIESSTLPEKKDLYHIQKRESVR